MILKDRKITHYCSYLSVYEKYSPDELIDAANKMKEDKITFVEFGCEYESPEIFFYKLETEEQARVRIEKQKEIDKMAKFYQEKNIKEAAEKLGYKLVKKR